MSVHANAPLVSLDWQRIVALGTSFALHVIAVAIVAIPIAMPLPRLLPKVAEVRIFEAKPPPPALPIPPEPLPLVRPRPSQHPVAVPAASQAPVTTTTTPTALPTATAPIAVAPISVAPISVAPISAAPGSAQASPAGGETRVLAYDGALTLKYPPMSVRQREQGTVLLRVLVDVDGNAQRIEIERSSGHPQLDAAAREALRHAHFRPVLRDGRAVPAWGMVPIEFRLDRM